MAVTKVSFKLTSIIDMATLLTDPARGVDLSTPWSKNVIWTRCGRGGIVLTSELEYISIYKERTTPHYSALPFWRNLWGQGGCATRAVTVGTFVTPQCNFGVMSPLIFYSPRNEVDRTTTAVLSAEHTQTLTEERAEKQTSSSSVYLTGWIC